MSFLWRTFAAIMLINTCMYSLTSTVRSSEIIQCLLRLFVYKLAHSELDVNLYKIVC